MKLVKIKSIKKIENDSKLYDISIRNTHNFFANNILVHNCSSTFYINNNEFGVCSRNIDLRESDSNTFWKIARKLNLENKMRSFNRNFAIQGEIIGPGIQKNKYELSEIELRVFKVFDIDKQHFIDYLTTQSLCTDLELKMVPTVHTTFILNTVTIPELVEMSKGISLLNPKIIREGLVFRSMIETKDEDLGWLSFKVINPEFLLKHEEQN